MSVPRCVVIGAGRMAGGFVAPLLRAAGWDVVLVGRDQAVISAINQAGGVWLRSGPDLSHKQWIDGVTAMSTNDPALAKAIMEADLLVTSVGPSALRAVGVLLAPLLRARFDLTQQPINIVAFENHRRSAERLALGLMESEASLAAEIGRRLGIGGVAVWRAISRREVTASGVCFDIDELDECYVDLASLVPGIAPTDGSVPGLTLVRSFDDRMVEKLWVFNGGHAAAAYLGWLVGCRTVDQAMAQPDVRSAVLGVVTEAQAAFEAYRASRPWSMPVPSRPIEWIIDRYSDPSLSDPIVRVGREPRRKLAADDRLIGPAVACVAAGMRPVALAAAAAAALAYAEPSDPQASDLRKEVQLVGPEEVLATVSTLEPQEELTRLISDQYRSMATREAIR